MKVYLTFFILMLMLSACTKNIEVDNYSEQLLNEVILIKVGDRTVNAYLSKPEGNDLELVLVLHGGTLNYQSSINATLNQATKEDAGRMFLEAGYAILALEYTEFSGSNDVKGVAKGIIEMEEVLQTIDFLNSNPFSLNDFNINGIHAFGHSRGGANALLAGIERPLKSVIAAEAPLNWEAIKDSIESGFLKPSEKELENFECGTNDWNDSNIGWIKYSPALRYQEFQSPFLIIAGEQDIATFIDMAVQMKENVEACKTCDFESEFIIHPRGHTDWANEEILNKISNFISMF